MTPGHDQRMEKSCESWSSRAARRLFDLLLSFILISLLMPIFAMTVILVRAGASGPAFFLQRRVGRHGAPFLLGKLRTMASAPGPLLTAADDPRVTKLGGFLRSFRIDEWPQLINVFVGHMSFVGPRPELAKFVESYGVYQPLLQSVRPGLTDPATLESLDEAEALRGHDDPESHYRMNLLPRKLAISADYLRHRNFGQDIRILARTSWALLRRGKRTGS